MYLIDRYTLDESGEIAQYEDVFITGNQVVARKKYKALLAEDPEGVYSLERVAMIGTRKMELKDWFEKNLAENNGQYKSCIIEATRNYPHRETLSRYQNGERPTFYFVRYIPKDTTKRIVR